MLLSGDANGVTEGIVLADGDRPLANAIQLQVAHAAPVVGDIDVYVLEPGESVEGSDPAIPDLEYPLSGIAPVLAALKADRRSKHALYVLEESRRKESRLDTVEALARENNVDVIQVEKGLLNEAVNDRPHQD